MLKQIKKHVSESKQSIKFRKRINNLFTVLK